MNQRIANKTTGLVDYKELEANILSSIREGVTLPRKSGEKVWNVFHKGNDESKCSGMQ